MNTNRSTDPESADVIVVGGGAAGLCAAAFAGTAGARVTVLETSRQCGLKILVSGGGRCNVLPVALELDDFFTSGSRNVLKRIFKTWPLEEVRRHFEEDLDVPLVEEPDTGKLFPRAQSARVVRDAWVRACERAGVRIVSGAPVTRIERASSGGFEVETATGALHRASRVILATGGKSLPKTGSDGSGYELARALGHSLVPTYPALVPLETGDPDLRELTGISLPVRWQARLGKRTREDRVRELLFTHRGFSGPAILDASHWAVRDGARILVSWEAEEEDVWRQRFDHSTRSRVEALIARHLPRRLAHLVCERSGVSASLGISHLPARSRESLLENLCRFPLPVEGDSGYRVAEVTGGGVPLGEIDPSTLESRTTPGLYLCGEILDVIGRIGGYNFQWAWVTGRLAGQGAARAGSRGAPD